jgi:hypothetical protein
MLTSLYSSTGFGSSAQNSPRKLKTLQYVPKSNKKQLFLFLLWLVSRLFIRICCTQAPYINNWSYQDLGTVDLFSKFLVLILVLLYWLFFLCGWNVVLHCLRYHGRGKRCISFSKVNLIRWSGPSFNRICCFFIWLLFQCWVIQDLIYCVYGWRRFLVVGFKSHLFSIVKLYMLFRFSTFGGYSLRLWSFYMGWL